MSQLRKTSTLIAGVGSAHGDDRVGWMICDQLAVEFEGATPPPNIEVIKLKSPIELMNWLPEARDPGTPSQLIICDACSGLGCVGEVAHWEWPNEDFGELGWSGTHDFSVLQTLTLADTLGRLPASVEIWGVEKGEDLGPAQSAFSHEIMQAIQQTARDIAVRSSNLKLADPVSGNALAAGIRPPRIDG